MIRKKLKTKTSENLTLFLNHLDVTLLAVVFKHLLKLVKKTMKLIHHDLFFTWLYLECKIGINKNRNWQDLGIWFFFWILKLLLALDYLDVGEEDTFYL